MKKSLLLTVAALSVMSAPAFAETIVSKTVDGGTTTTTTTTRTFMYPSADANNNGILDSAEFTPYVYHRWDTDRSGFITSDEWDASTVRWYGPKVTTYKTYGDWDMDKDGRLNDAEFEAMVNTTGLYTSWDVNADKVLETNEYSAQTFRLYDTNDDGALSLSEWQAAN